LQKNAGLADGVPTTRTSTQTTMATARITQAVPANVDPIKATLAFGDRAIPRLERELQSTDLLTVQRALMALCDMIRNPQHIRTSLNQGITPCLLKLFSHADGVVRQKSSEAVLHFAGHAIGRDAIVKQQLMKSLASLFKDSVAVVRLNVQNIMQLTSTQQAGAYQLVEFNLVSTLLECLQSETEPAIQNTILMTLYNTMKVNTDVLLNGGAMKVFVQFLDSSTDVSIRKNVARNIMALSIPLDGKVQACENDAIPPLVFLLRNTRPPTALGNDEDWYGVASAAAGALMSITVTTRGKKMAIAAGALDELGALLEVDDERVVLNGIKLITTLAEHPMGRSQLQALVPKLTALKDYPGGRLDHMAVPRNAQTAIDTIVWKP